MWYIHTMDSYSSTERKHVITWMDLENMLGEMSQTQKEKVFDFTYIK